MIYAQAQPEKLKLNGELGPALAAAGLNHFLTGVGAHTSAKPGGSLLLSVGAL
jgi:hypothetical protein